ncbi:MAG: acetyl-CoA carboxylase biotin carboxylase subunit [Acidobacteria bacterium]|nr:MAG: acetyl-CoA carboxylase biotin carboxylase subunit [Acidobacteriota bacterium]
MFEKLLIANRGEIAVRIIRACRDLGISPVAVYSDPDRDALHVKLADEAIPIGGETSVESYLRIDKLIEAASTAHVQALHPGYGFLAESEQLAQACEDSGICFVGPSADAMAIMAKKVTSRAAAEKAGVPVVPGTLSPVRTREEALEAAEKLGFPLFVKADAGGGGKGMRIARSPEELLASMESAAQEAQAAFGDPAVYLERQLQRPRHIEIQMLGDRHGNLVHLGERECSVQRRHQKIVEECPSPMDDEDLRERLGQAALAIAGNVGYYSAGTVEFLVESDDPRSFYFLEMNTRLQVEHPVTEMVTNLDIVCEQIRIAAGQKLSGRQEDVRLRGAAIECRIYAEDPTNNFLPSPGTVTELAEPAGPGIRNDSALYCGYQIPVHYDPLVSKLIAYGNSRDEAIRRMLRALGEYRVGGIPTTVSFLRRLISHPDFRNGQLHTGFLEEHHLFDEEVTENAFIPLAGAALEHLLNGKKSREIRPRRNDNRWKLASRPDVYWRKW